MKASDAHGDDVVDRHFPVWFRASGFLFPALHEVEQQSEWEEPHFGLGEV